MRLSNLTILNEVLLEVHEFPQQSGHMWIIDCCFVFVGDCQFSLMKTLPRPVLVLLSGFIATKCLKNDNDSCVTHSDKQNNKMQQMYRCATTRYGKDKKNTGFTESI